jgi:hypothetical protein
MMSRTNNDKKKCDFFDYIIVMDEWYIFVPLLTRGGR